MAALSYLRADIWRGADDEVGGEEAAVYVERTDADEVAILTRFIADDGDRPGIYLSRAAAEALALELLRAALPEAKG